MNKCDFCTIAINKDGKLVCPRKKGSDYTFCSEALERIMKLLKKSICDKVIHVGCKSLPSATML